MREILFATGNEAKVKRFRDKLLERNVRLLTLKDIDMELDVLEDGSNAIQNALIKARAYHKVTGMITLAMDDTLFLEQVPSDMQPGMYVRRVQGRRLSDDEMISYYSNLAKKYGQNGRITARWIYGMALINQGKEFTYTWSKDDFYLVDKPSSIVNPGYPLNFISVNKKLNKYFTDLTEEDKVLCEEDESDVVQFIVDHLS